MTARERLDEIELRREPGSHSALGEVCAIARAALSAQEAAERDASGARFALATYTESARERHLADIEQVAALRSENAGLREVLEGAMRWGIELGTADPEWVAEARRALASPAPAVSEAEREDDHA